MTFLSGQIQQEIPVYTGTGLFNIQVCEDSSCFPRTQSSVIIIPKDAERWRFQKIGSSNGYVGIPAAMLFAEVVKFEKVYGFHGLGNIRYKIEMLTGEAP